VPIAIVVHTMGGTLQGTDSWFRNPTSYVSAHYGVGLDGRVHQYVDLANVAWANGVVEPGNRWADVLDAAHAGALGPLNPNLLTVSIETEDLGRGQTFVSDAQMHGVLVAASAAVMRYPSIRVVTGHDVISPTSRAHCPGDRWRIRGDLGELAGHLKLAVV
jgi:N-acetylmuramoyl-L-alanine amidase